MNKIIKWTITFSVLIIWSLFVGVDKTDLLRKDTISLANAISFQVPMEFYYEDDTLINKTEMKRILYYSDFEIYKASRPYRENQTISQEELSAYTQELAIGIQSRLFGKTLGINLLNRLNINDTSIISEVISFDQEIYIVKINKWRFRKNHCAVKKILNRNPIIIKKFNELSISGCGSVPRAGVFVGGGIS